MANPNAPFGFRPVARVGGAPFRTSQYAKPASDSQAIFMFDLCNKVAAGIADPTGAGPNIPGIQSEYAGTPGTTLIVGSVMNYGAASTLTTHLVADEIDLILIAQCKTGTTISTASHVGKNANVSNTTAGSTTTKQSGETVDGATIATTATLDVRIRAIAAISPNAAGDSAILEVSINKHFYGNAVAGV